MASLLFYWALDARQHCHVGLMELDAETLNCDDWQRTCRDPRGVSGRGRLWDRKSSLRVGQGRVQVWAERGDRPRA